MFDLGGLYHLPELKSALERLVSDGPGLIVVAGMDPRPAGATATADVFAPSGRATVFRMLVQQMLAAQPSSRTIVVSDPEDRLRAGRWLRSRADLLVVQESDTYAQRIAEACERRPDLLVVDQLTMESAPASLEAAQQGLRVLSQLDTIFRGEQVVRHLHDLGVPDEALSGLGWVVAVQRLPTLCPRCRQETVLSAEDRLLLRQRVSGWNTRVEEAAFYRAQGCDRCRHSGRQGEVSVFDVWRATADAEAGPDRLTLEAYLLRLATQGMLSVDDLLWLETDQLHRTYNLLSASERVLAEANASLELRVAELEAAHRVLQQRTAALLALESIGQALIASTRLEQLAGQLCDRVRDLCHADRAILYFLHPGEEGAEVLGVSGWDRGLLHRRVDASLVREAVHGTEPATFDHWPPGIPRHPTDVTAGALQTGVGVPLVAQGRQVGAMVVHSSHRGSFGPGEVALLQTFAHQAAVALQRAGLVDALQEKVVALEAAQAELVQKERLERELELARQVQQSVLPRIFPLVPGYGFGACNEPARRVGGDFYDVILLDAERFGLVVADVSDKGMPAALYMALTRSLILAESRRDLSPRAVLARVHQLLLELGQPDMFVTVFYAVVDGPARRMMFARAGHDSPLLLRSGGGRALGGDGMILGHPSVDDLHLSEEVVDLLPGDRLVLYTDGLIDLLGPDERRFGRDRLMRLLRGLAQTSPAEMCAATFSALGAYRGTAEQYDDMTMLVVEVLAEDR